MTSFTFPYNIPMSDVVYEKYSLPEEVKNKVVLVECDADNIIVLYGLSLYAVKVKGEVVSSKDMYVVVDVDDSTEEVVNKLKYSKNVIISTVKQFDYKVCDCYTPFRPQRGDSFISFTGNEGFTEMDALFLALSLSYTFGTKFDFYHSDADSCDYTLVFDKLVPTRSNILSKINKHKSEIEKRNYINSLKVVKRYLPKDDFDDFD